ncbi:hypothetical protein [Kiloniella sp.]|uniref:hypothetical protein n=1 Tax=Kiloniella sp. TaxID=1938587 RepID=UPI003B026144
MTDQTPLNQKDKEQLQFLLDCYGAYEHHWPEDKRSWMLDLMKESTEAQHLRSQVIDLDQLLDLAPSEPNTVHLLDSILATAPTPAANKFALKNWWPYESIWRPLSALTTAGAFGLMLGTSSPDWVYNQDNIELEEAYVSFSETSFTGDFLEGEIN